MIKALLAAGAGLVAVSAALFISLLLGKEFFTPAQLFSAVMGEGDVLSRVVLLELRLPRSIIALLVGAALATGGGVMQGIARNPLASPDLTGVVAGAACAIVTAISIAQVDTRWLPLVGLGGGLGAGLLTFTLAWKGQIQPLRLVLAGVATSALCVSVMSAMLLFSGSEASELFFWLAGGLAGRGWDLLNEVAVWILLPVLITFLLSARFRVLLLDDAVAQTLGVSVNRWKLFFLVMTALMTTAAVIVAGPVGFIGLVVPHITRKIFDEQRATWLPLNALAGALLLLAADLLARMSPCIQEIPLGVVTALLGGPWLLWLVSRQAKVMA